MKVLMLTPSFFPIVGGTESFVQDITLRLNQIGIHTDVMTFNMSEKWNPIWREEVKRDYFKVFRVPAFNVFHEMRYNPLEILFEVNVIPKFNFTKRLKNYDILHFHDDVDLSLPLFSCFIKKPKIFQCHTLSAMYRQYKTGFFSRTILKKAGHSYICVSNFAEKLLVNLGIPESKIFIVHSGVDIEKFKPNKLKKIDNLILFVGRLDRSKGLHVLLDSLKYLNNPVCLKIIGPKQDYRYVEQTLGSKEKQKIGIHEIEWLGKLYQNKIIEWYQKASVFVCPSLKEDLGIVNLEALSCETPVVASNVGGISEIIKNDVNGILIPPNDPEVLAIALKKLLDNKGLREKYGKRGRRIVEEHFSWDKTMKELIKIYKNTY